MKTLHDFFVMYGINNPQVEENVTKCLHDEGYTDSEIVTALTDPDALYPRNVTDDELEEILEWQVMKPKYVEPTTDYSYPWRYSVESLLHAWNHTQIY